MRFSALLALLLVTASCTGGADEAATSSDTATAQQSALPVPAGPDVQFFSSTDSAMVVDGAGCAYSAPGVMGDSMLFVYAEDGGMLVNGRTQILKLVDEGGEELASDSTTDKVGFENAAYRVELRMVTDTMMEGGASQHGEMTVEDKRSGLKTTVALKGGCGC